MKRTALALLVLGLACPLVAQQTPGQIRPRPAEGREPEFKPPTIREYKPKSQLVTPQHHFVDVNGWAELKELPSKYEGFCW